eukprot:1160781-Pelagomonas_calceolata.AAC.5
MSSKALSSPALGVSFWQKANCDKTDVLCMCLGVHTSLGVPPKTGQSGDEGLCKCAVIGNYACSKRGSQPGHIGMELKS